MVLMKKRCSWVNKNNKLYIKYHDEEWGSLVGDDDKLFEIFSLEIFQSGLSFETIFNKRQNFKRAFDDFCIEKVVLYDDEKVKNLLKNSGIVRHRKKIEATINNAKVFLHVRKEFGSLQNYFYSFSEPKSLLKDLKNRGTVFIGEVTIKSFLETIGVLNGHEKGCFKSVTDKVI